MTAQEARQLEDALRARLGAQVEVEEISAGRYRFGVIAPGFEGVAQLRRQDQVWQIVDETLPPPARLDVSLILAFAPGELQVAP